MTDEKKEAGSKHLTEIEIFVREHLTYINHSAGEISYVFEGDNYEEGFSSNPLIAIRAAIKRISKMKQGKEANT
jgi:hypothetical protein